MREIAIVQPSQHQRENFVPVGTFSETRKMSPERDLILPDQLFAEILLNLNSEAKVVSLLAVCAGGMRTARSVTEYINSFSPTGEAVIGKETVREILNRFVEAQMLDAERVGKEVHFAKPPSIDYYTAQAGYLYEFSRSHPGRLKQIFGSPEAARRRNGNSDSEELARDYMKDRIAVIRLIYLARKNNNPYIPLPISVTSVADELGISQESAQGHLEDLVAAEALSFSTINPADGAYQLYQLKEDRPVDPRKSNGRYALNRVLREFVRQEGCFNSDQAVEYILSQIQENEGLSEDELGKLGIVKVTEEGKEELDLQIIRARVIKAIAYLRDKKIIEVVGPYSRENKSTISFKPQSEQLTQLRNTVLTLFDLQKEDSQTERQGLVLAQRFLRDSQGVERMVGKIAVDNHSRREAKKKTVI